jgi:hypothetical protein
VATGRVITGPPKPRAGCIGQLDQRLVLGKQRLQPADLEIDGRRQLALR